MKRLLILIIILIVFSCKEKMNGLKEVTNSTNEFKIGVPKSLKFDTITDSNKSVIKFNEKTVFFEIKGFNKRPTFEQKFRDTLVDFNERNLLLRTKSDFYNKNGFEIYEQYAIGLDTLSYIKFSRIDYWLVEKNDNYFITLTAERKDSLFSEKEFDLIEKILNSIERKKQ